MPASATLVANAGDASRPPIAANTKQMDGFMGDWNQKDRDEFPAGGLLPLAGKYQDNSATFIPGMGQTAGITQNLHHRRTTLAGKHPDTTRPHSHQDHQSPMRRPQPVAGNFVSRPDSRPAGRRPKQADARDRKPQSARLPPPIPCPRSSTTRSSERPPAS